MTDATGAAAAAWREGEDGSHPVYEERLGAHWVGWVFSVVVCATIGVAYGHFTGTFWGWVTFVVCQVVAVLVLLANSPLLRVDERVLRAGRARLPRGCIGRVRVLDADAAARLRGPEADPRAYQCTRSWFPLAVAVEVLDPADPHPYWLVSTRHPDRLLTALTDRDTPDALPAPPAGD